MVFKALDSCPKWVPYKTRIRESRGTSSNERILDEENQVICIRRIFYFSPFGFLFEGTKRDEGIFMANGKKPVIVFHFRPKQSKGGLQTQTVRSPFWSGGNQEVTNKRVRTPLSTTTTTFVLIPSMTRLDFEHEILLIGTINSPGTKTCNGIFSVEAKSRSTFNPNNGMRELFRGWTTEYFIPFGPPK